MDSATNSVPLRAREKVTEVLRQMEPLVASTLSDFVRIPSVNASYPGVVRSDVLGGETDAAVFMLELGRRHGAVVDLVEDEPGRANAVAVFGGSGAGRSLILNGHHDVVPPGPSDDWRFADPFSGRIEDGFVWGRGAADMKGSIVAQSYAAYALREAGILLAGDLILQSVSGEETGEFRIGTGACLARGYRADAAIVGEPSSVASEMNVNPASMGILTFRLIVVGRATHAGLRGRSLGSEGAEIGVSAIDKGALLLESLAELDREWVTSVRHDLYEPGSFRIMPGVIAASPTSALIPYMIPDRFEAEFVVWYPPGVEADWVREQISQAVARTAAADPWLREVPPTIEWVKNTPPADLDPQHPLCSGLAETARLTGADGPSPISGFLAGAEVVRFHQAGIPAVNLGSGDLRHAHSVDERVSLREVSELALRLALFAMQWCGIEASSVPGRAPLTRSD